MIIIISVIECRRMAATSLLIIIIIIIRAVVGVSPSCWRTLESLTDTADTRRRNIVPTRVCCRTLYSRRLLLLSRVLKVLVLLPLLLPLLLLPPAVRPTAVTLVEPLIEEPVLEVAVLSNLSSTRRMLATTTTSIAIIVLMMLIKTGVRFKMHLKRQLRTLLHHHHHHHPWKWLTPEPFAMLKVALRREARH